ncbi:uroporphyrinogen-III C-methyltransferase [Natribacillus halophilus]|uniref:uroporphyrinogen-III C-methyltransferase n=1 Tax=Natribacillus halophilus TaxID=549003 RepID=A0A1G8M833_9BACI|nr:uroporphyrinogen-III C-methyltransferase [Natribacillus halophilus]SDI63987.1 uroporphyrinogen-III C-methyltransferase [Natribacillus halophilus]
MKEAEDGAGCKKPNVACTGRVMLNKGHVAIVGAGPGDPELVTEKGKALLADADVVVYDRLVHPLLLEHTKEDARRIYSGKIPRGHSMRQSTIQDMLMDFAQQGENVVRLKGGDPGVFAHLGEEAKALQAAGIPFEMVPGLTAGLAGAVYAGVPATYRSLSTSVALVTGHSRKEMPLSDVAIPSADTLIFYMGMRYLSFWMARLMEEGWDVQTPVVIVQWSTTSKQRTASGTLMTIADEANRKKLMNPALVIVGKTAQCHPVLSWYEALPLQGESILWANDGGPDRADTANALKRLGAHVFSYPGDVFTFNPPMLSAPLPTYQRVHFEDATSVSFFFQFWESRRYDLRLLPAHVSGTDDETRKALVAQGLPPDGENNPDLVISTREGDGEHEHWQIADRHPSVLKEDIFSRLDSEEWINTVLFTAPGQIYALDHRLAEGLKTYCADKRVVCAGEETLRVLKTFAVDIHKYTENHSHEALVSVLCSDGIVSG